MLVRGPSPDALLWGVWVAWPVVGADEPSACAKARARGDGGADTGLADPAGSAILVILISVIGCAYA